MHNYNRNSYVHSVMHSNVHKRNSHMLNCNRKIHQYTTNNRYQLKTCINATEIATCRTAIESVGCTVPTETSTCRTDYKNFHQQKWYQSEICLVTIKKLSELVSTEFKANSFSTPCITYRETQQWIVSMNQLCYRLIISIFNFLIFIHFKNQITLKPSLAQRSKLIFKFSKIYGQMFHSGPTWGIKEEGWKNFYSIALKF